MAKKQKTYAAYNGASYKVHDVYIYDSDLNSSSYGEITAKIGEVWTRPIRVIPDEAIAVYPPIIKGKSTLIHIKYLKGERMKLNFKKWVEKHVGMRVQEYA
jgi:hypothetical protein